MEPRKTHRLSKKLINRNNLSAKIEVAKEIRKMVQKLSLLLKKHAKLATSSVIELLVLSSSNLDARQSSLLNLVIHNEGTPLLPRCMLFCELWNGSVNLASGSNSSLYDYCSFFYVVVSHMHSCWINPFFLIEKNFLCPCEMNRMWVGLVAS